MLTMKKAVCAIMVVVAFFLIPAVSWAVELSVSPLYNMYDGNEITQSLGVKATLGGNTAHVFGSVEDLDRRFGGQECVKMRLWGFGIGAGRELLQGLRLSFDIGYFLPDETTKLPFHLDGAHYAFAKGLGISIGDPRYYFWEHYSYHVGSGIGGSLSVLFRHAFSSRFSVFGGVGYRCLKLEEAVYGWNGKYDGSLPHWQMFHATSFSGAQLYLFGLSYEFKGGGK